MAANQNVNASEEQSRQLAEESREADWNGRGFMKEMFLGNFRVDWIDPWPETKVSDEFLVFERKLEEFMRTKVDSSKIDETGEYGDEVIEGFRKLGCFGIKIPKKYGGLGFNNVEYCRALEMMGRYDGNCVALISAHNSIGVPQPLKLFGNEEQKQKYLTRCAAGAISAFALTEPDVGSDPARLGTVIERDENGDFLLTGEKLWITNSTFADLLVVMARHSDTGKISAVVVEMDWEGVEVAYRCRFMGLRALQNGVIKFNKVKVPKENLIWGEGKGLKLALITLNTGRLSIPAACVGGAKAMLEDVRQFSHERVQWGVSIGKHEAISHQLSDMATKTWGMECLSQLATELSEREGYDIRLEASAAKEWCTTRGWDVTDMAIQVKGGRGYETESSLNGRGEKGTGLERGMRDSRINRIFEGSSEIMHLLMARDLVDTHLKISGVMLDPKATIGDKIKALPGMIKFYGIWYPKLWIGGLFRPSYSKFGRMGKHLKYIERSSRRLARSVFHGMVRYQKGMERKQAFLFRSVDIAMELMVMAATIVRTQKLISERDASAEQAQAMTEMLCLDGRRYVDTKFDQLWNNDDAKKYAFGKAISAGQHTWLEPKLVWDAPETASGETAAAK